MNDLQPMELLPPTMDTPHTCARGWKDLLCDESGQDMIEYVLVASLIALGAVSAMSGLSTRIAAAYTSLSSNLTSNT